MTFSYARTQLFSTTKKKIKILFIVTSWLYGIQNFIEFESNFSEIFKTLSTNFKEVSENF